MRDVPMPQFRMMILPLTAALLLTIAGCSKSPDTDSAKASAAESADADHAESGEADHAEGTEGHDGEGAEGEAAAPVIMDAAALKAAGIRLQTLQPSSLSEELRAPGEVLDNRSEEHTSELKSLMRITYDVFCLKKKNQSHKTAGTH